jgi:hypothetical protein
MSGTSFKLVKRPLNIQGAIPRNLFVREYSRAVAESLVDLRGDLVENSPVGGTANLKGSWISDGPNVDKTEISGNVSSSEIQALVIDQGAKPHTPPSGDSSGLRQWVNRRLRITDPTKASTAAFLISRKIKSKGLPKRGIFTARFKALEPNFDRIMERAKKRLVKFLGDK